MKMKRFLTMLLAATLLFTALPSMGTLTVVEGADGGQVAGNDEILEGKKIDTIYGSAVKGSDGAVYKEYSFTAVNYKNGSYSTKTTNTFNCKELIGVDSSKNQSWLYCVEYNTGFSRDGYSSSNVNNSKYLQYGGTLSKGLDKLAKDKKISGLNGDTSIEYILMATIYGWQPDATMPQELKDQKLNDWDWYYGTQVVIWEFQQGIRQSPTQRNGNGFNARDTLFKWIDGRPAEYAYNYVIKMMAQHRTVPSFSTKDVAKAPTHTLRWNSTNRRYELTLTDTAGYAFGLKFDNSDINVTKNGSNYTIYTTKTITTPVLCSAQKNITIAEDQELLVWGKSGKQTMISGMQDPVEFYLKVQTEKPTISIEKTGTTSADIANKVFYVYKDNSNTACLTLTTNASGKASGSLPGNGTYRIVEQNASKYNVTYTINNSATQNFTYPSSAFDANNNVTVKVNNALKTGTLQLRKESEDNVVQGFQFRIEGNGTNITGTTSASGYLVVNGSTDIALLPGTYTITEIATPDRYVDPEPITVTIEADTTIKKTVTNRLEPSSLKIVKQSDDDVVAGMQFRITGRTTSGKTVDKSVITGADGTILTDMEQGTYTVSEINVPSRYYTPISQEVTLSSKDGKVVTFTNQLKPGALQILKTSEDGVVEGLQFRVRSESAAKAYFVDVAGVRIDGCTKYAVIDRDATAGQVLLDLGLNPEQYYVVLESYNSGSSTPTYTYKLSNTSLVASVTSGTTDNVSTLIHIYSTTDASTPVAQVVFLGCMHFGANRAVAADDLTKAQEFIGQTVADKAYPESLYLATYDVDQNGTITQNDIDIITDAYNNSTWVTNANKATVDITGTTNADGYVVFGDSTTLTVPVGKYHITELEVPDRYTTGFDQVIEIAAEETKIVKVTNLLKASGVKIIKQADDGVIARVRFSIVGKTNAGANVNMEVVTDETGLIAQSLEYGTYTITELAVADRYVEPAPQTVTIHSQDYVTVTFNNELADSALKLIKKSEDGVVDNISFRIQSVVTADGSVVDATVKTGTDGTISTTLPQGTYIVTELNVAERYVEPASQTVILTAGATSTVTFENVLKVPHLEIKKTSEDGIVEGIQFQITGTTLTGEPYAGFFATDENGLIAEDIPQGTYTVTELTDGRYEAQTPQTVTLKNDETATVEFKNTLKEGTLKIVKTSEDGTVKNVPFHIAGFGTDGVEVDLTLTTDATGVITTKLKPGTYTVSELLDDEKYMIQEPQEVTVVYGQTATVSFVNTLKKFKLILTKTDGSTEMGLPQGDGTMEGAVYGLYKEDGTLIGQYTTDAEGKITTEAIPCQAVYVQEITAPKGYVLDENQYWLESSIDDCYLAVTNIPLNVVDYPIMGSISILKKMGLEDEWEYESGAVFQVFLKSAGSYEASNDWERDQITTDEATDAENNNLGEATTGGHAGTKDLPLGTYIVRQISGSEGYQLAGDIEVTITEEETVIELDVLNQPGDEFPFTGGSGVTPYVVGGIVLMLMACVVAVAAKKKATV